MKVLTADQMREVDRRTIELGISGAILMENAGHRVVEFVSGKFSPLSRHRIVVLCGKGNNGGDGFVIARQLWTRFRTQSLYVVDLSGSAESEARKMLLATGCPVEHEIRPEMRNATLIIDAVLGTGVNGPARGDALGAIREINSGFPLAQVIAVDLPSGMNSDSGVSAGEIARADATVTFTAPKLCHVLSPNCDALGELRITQIGSPASLMENIKVHFSEPADFRHLLGPRKPDSNKGIYGHVLVVGGAEGKTGAAEMAGLAALRMGAGLATVASSSARLSHLELMTHKLPWTFDELKTAAERINVIAIGPGLGTSDKAVDLVHAAVATPDKILVIDADGLNCLAKRSWRAAGTCILTPHPGEMSRLADRSVADVQSNRLEIATEYAAKHNCFLVLKGHRTVVALPDGRLWINPTGSPAMATGGTGDILTGLTAGMLAQCPNEPNLAVVAAVWLHGRSGELGARVLGERPLLATDLLTYLPEAIRECQDLADEL